MSFRKEIPADVEQRSREIQEARHAPDFNQYSVLALEVIHELQRVIDRQQAEINEGLARERNLLDKLGEVREEIEELTEAVAQYNEKRKA